MAVESARRVLVADDNATFRKLLRFLLEDAGYVVDQVHDGTSAFEYLLASEDRLVVLLDMTMPGMDGIQVMRAVAEHEPLATRHAYVLLTALAGDLPHVSVDFLQELGVPIVGKNVNIDRLLRTVQQASHRLALTDEQPVGSNTQ